VNFTKNRYITEEDVNDYVEALKQALLKQIKETRRISLYEHQRLPKIRSRARSWWASGFLVRVCFNYRYSELRESQTR
jgi:hypothetical protein